VDDGEAAANVEGPARRRLISPNIRLIEPVSYASLVWLLERSLFALTDSGGIQEEGATLGKPVLVLREVTERPEIVQAGAGILVGTNRNRIVAEATRLLTDAGARARMGGARSLFGDGRAGERIAAALSGNHPDPWRPDPVPPA
jgi:UDP-N-acetylglucosamine 2-epimerase (non-hydrolysing)